MRNKFFRNDELNPYTVVRLKTVESCFYQIFSFVICSIRTESHGGAWCPKQEATSDPKEWLEVDLRQVHVVTAVETQGRFGNGQGQEYTEAYHIEYWRPKLGKWKRYRNMKGEEVSFLSLPSLGRYCKIFVDDA